MTDKIETEKAKVNLKTDRAQLLDKKNSLVAKREKFRAEIVTLNIVGLSNVLVCRYQDPLLKPIQDKLNTKKSTLFDGIKKNL